MAVTYRLTRRPLLLVLSLGYLVLLLQLLGWHRTSSSARPRPRAYLPTELAYVDETAARTPRHVVEQRARTALAESAGRLDLTGDWSHFGLRWRRQTWDEYEQGLRDVWAEFFETGSALRPGHSMAGRTVAPSAAQHRETRQHHADPRLSSILKTLSFFPPAAPPIHPTVWTTSRDPASSMPDAFRTWGQVNVGWDVQWWTDDDIDAWLLEEFGSDAGITREMVAMRDGWGILRADVFR